MSKKASTLAATYRVPMQSARILVQVKRPRRWRTTVFCNGPHGEAQDIIITQQPARLTDVLVTALASLDDVLSGVTDIYEAGFDVEMLR